MNDYECLNCGQRLKTPLSQVLAHRRAPRGQSNQPGTYTYS
ncbi:hypothetical protein [Nocardioides sp. URHA0020]|nr:hypothetical protein [Nocardioides sp. URHA0020]